MFGLFNFLQTVYVPADAELIKQITVKHFDHFVNRDHSLDDVDRVLSKSLFSLQNQQWREMRT